MHDVGRLIERPIAHRGLHDASNHIIENTPSAFAAAMAANYGIELDVQLTADADAIVHHDPALGRLTEGAGRLADLTVAELKRVAFKATSDRMITLGELCDSVAGRVPLLIELKSGFSGDLRIAERAAAVLSSYDGPAALMSFDPELVAALRQKAPRLLRGIVAERWYTHMEWHTLSARQRRNMGNLLHLPRTQPHFVAYSVKDLPASAPLLARWIFGRPLLTWTVRSDEDRARAARWADQMIFEGFRP